MKKIAHIASALAACALVASLGLAGCASGSTASYKDGTYLGKSSVLDANVDGDGYVEVQVTIKDGQISDASYVAYKPDGTVKDKDYGKDTAYYGVAQKALSTGDDYLAQFKETGAPEAIDTISGATYLHDLFVEAAEDALNQATE